MQHGPPQVFISHIHEDADFAKAIASWLERTLLRGIECFVSSDDSIPLGREWPKGIQNGLAGASIMLVLVSPTSAARRWIYFEAGAGFIRGIPVVPICICGMALVDLEPPLNLLQAIQLPSAESERKLLSLVATPAHLNPPSTQPDLVLPTRSEPTNWARHLSDENEFGHIFENADDDGFVEFFRSLVVEAQRVVLVGTGLNILYRRHPLDLLDAKKQQHWEIFVANPYSPEVETRLIEEETGSPKPPVGKAGLITRLEALLEKQAHLDNESTLSVSLFSHYPTISFFIVDNMHYFVYPYGFSRLGDFSPVLYCCKPNVGDAPWIKFLDEQYQLIKSASVDANLIQELRTGRTFSIQHIQNKLIPLAVYIVPDDGTAMYQFGTDCIGFDVRKQMPRQSRWPAAYLRDAAEFGFHLTVADALYFAEEQAVAMLRREIRMLAKQFRPFLLDFELQEAFPDASSISIVCRDDTGSLESLHHELVFRLYTRAIASNYSPLLGSAAAKLNRTYLNPA